MGIIPVLDLLHGVVVRGLGGRRDEYRPLVSLLTNSTEPLAVARELRSLCGRNFVYLADLDAILHGQPNWDSYRKLLADGCDMLLDAGVRNESGACRLAEIGADVVIGLETIANPAMLRSIVAQLGPQRIVFSLDLKQGQPLGGPGWPPAVATICQQVMDAGVRRLIVLDLADVGSGTGGSTLTLCRWILDRWPHVELIAGGGVRGPDDLARWQRTGVSSVLVASALHDGRIKRDDLQRLLSERGALAP